MSQQDIEELILDHQYKKNEIIRFKDLYGTTEQLKVTSGLREINILKRWESCEKDISLLYSFYDYLADEKQFVIFDCMLDGMNFTDIAKHFNVSRPKFHDMKAEMLNQICEKLNTPRQGT